MSEKKIVMYDGINIRRLWHNDQWYYSVSDIIAVLTDSTDPKSYWRKLKQREPQIVTICHKLKMKSSDGKKYSTDCVNFQSSLRIIQSIPSKKAEPFKVWLASLGQAEVYRQQGYDENWIEQRMKSKLARYEITDEWMKRGISLSSEFAKLTNVIHKETFDKNISDHREHKNIGKTQNLRDNMTDLELLFSTLGERISKEITINRDSLGLRECEDSAIRGGSVAGRARKDAEREIGKPVVSKKNKLDLVKEKKALAHQRT